MIRIGSPRTEKAVRRLAKRLGTTMAEAVAIACERMLDETAATGRAKRRARLDRVLSEIWKKHKLPASEAERARLAGHNDLYGPDGLPR